MYSEQSVIDKIEVLEDGQIQVRRADRVIKDGIKISETYHRHVIAPGDDVSKEDEKVRVVANVVWTKEVKEAYMAKKAEKK